MGNHHTDLRFKKLEIDRFSLIIIVDNTGII